MYQLIDKCDTKGNNERALKEARISRIWEKVMCYRVYLDQNVISALRRGGGIKESWSVALEEALLRHNCKIYYSTHTLDEINQAGNKIPYLDVLKSLDAKYCFIFENIENMSVDNRSIEEVWGEYIAHNEMLSDLGMDLLTNGAIDYLKIISGCNTGRDLYEGAHELSDQIDSILQKSIAVINDFLPLSESLEDYFKLTLHQSLENIKLLKGINHIQLHPDRFRQHLGVKKKTIESLSPNELLAIVRQLSTEEILNERKDKKALFIYLMLNLIGYQCDDYTRNRGARFLASLRDALHVQSSIYLDVFITSDKKLIEKAKIIYYALSLRTAVYSPEEFLDLLNNTSVPSI